MNASAIARRPDARSSRSNSAMVQSELPIAISFAGRNRCCCLWVTRNSMRDQSASMSSTGQNCRRCSARDKIQDDRNSANRPCTSTSAYSRARCGSRQAPAHEGSAADDSPAGSRNHARSERAACDWTRRTRPPAATTGERHSRAIICATSLQARLSFAPRRFKSRFAAMLAS